MTASRVSFSAEIPTPLGRGAREAWQQLEAFVAERGDVEFSQILCPACLQAEFGAVVTPEPLR